MTNQITIYSQEEFEKIKKAGELAAKALDYVCSFAKPGVTTDFLDGKFIEFLNENGGNAACLGYHGYPKNLCVSINEEICHGIPGSRKLADGDVVSIDLVVELDGYHGDTCRTISFGKQSKRIELLIDITEKALMHAINNLKIGMHFRDIGKIIEDYVKPYRLGIVKEYCGHGVGRTIHEAPQILHYWNPNEQALKIEEGMCFTIEPMICEGKGDNKTLADGWTVVSKDKSVCAQFEHTIFMQADGPVICTKV